MRTLLQERTEVWRGCTDAPGPLAIGTTNPSFNFDGLSGASEGGASGRLRDPLGDASVMSWDLGLKRSHKQTTWGLAPWACGPDPQEQSKSPCGDLSPGHRAGSVPWRLAGANRNLWERHLHPKRGAAADAVGGPASQRCRGHGDGHSPGVRRNSRWQKRPRSSDAGLPRHRLQNRVCVRK